LRLRRKGRALIKRGKASSKAPQPLLSHNRVKRYPLAANEPDAFLEAVGIMRKEGRVRASMRGKFRQINEFLRIITRTLPKARASVGPINIVDCGCGNAYLIFAAWHSLREVLGLEAKLVGIDRDEEILENCRRLRAELGWENVDVFGARGYDLGALYGPGTGLR